MDVQQGTRARRVHEAQGTDVEAELSALTVHRPGHSSLAGPAALAASNSPET
jgi:hypothetical protein